MPRDKSQECSIDTTVAFSDDLHLYRAVFACLPGQVAILDLQGRIRDVNAGWKRFARENTSMDMCSLRDKTGKCAEGFPLGGISPEAYSFVGVNYLEVCRNTTGHDAGEAVNAADGIRAVLEGRLERFSMEYPCHAPWEKRWFLLSTTPLVQDGEVRGGVVFHLPITDRKLAEMALAQSEKRLNEAQRLARVGSYERDVRTGVGYWSNELFRMMGLPIQPHSPSLEAFLMSVHPDDRKMVRDYLRQAIADGLSGEYEFRVVSGDGGIRHFSSYIEVEMDGEGRAVRYRGAMVDVTRLKNVEAELIKLASTDELTGIFNRRHFLEILREEIARCARYGHPLSLAMLDIDNFKRINDSHGHAVGDEVLRSLTATVGRTLRGTDVFGRLGGEEFAVLLTETAADAAFTTCQRIVLSVAESGAGTSAGPLPLTVSIGVVTVSPCPDSMNAGEEGLAARGLDPDSLLKRADDALYLAKAEGKNRVVRGKAPCSENEIASRTGRDGEKTAYRSGNPSSSRAEAKRT